MIFRPQSPILLPIPTIGQTDAGECLAACVAMVCTYWDIPTDYGQLIKLLDIERGIGTPFYRIRELESLGLSVIYQENGTLEELYDLLVDGWPIIVSVETKELPYWKNVSTRHVIVAVGMDQDYVYLNDPEFSDTAIQTPLGEFDLAWLAQGEQYAVLSPASA